MRKIKHLLTPAFIVASCATAFLTPSSVQALNSAEKKECTTQWAGAILDTQTKKNKFNNSKCAKQNYCSATSTKQVDDTGRPVVVQIVQCGADRDRGAGGTTTSDPQTAPSCAKLETSIVKCDTTTDNPVIGLFLQIVNFLAVGVGIAVLGGIIWGGMLYASSNGDSAKAKQGVTVIVNAVLGLILFMFTFALINYLVPGGLFS